MTHDTLIFHYRLESIGKAFVDKSASSMQTTNNRGNLLSQSNQNEVFG